MGQDAILVDVHNKGFGSTATVDGWNSLSGAERDAAMKAVGRNYHSATTSLKVAREVEIVRKWDSESSGDERDKKARESNIILVEFNKSLRETNLRKKR